MSETITTEDLQRLHARLDAKQDELLNALKSLSSLGASERPGGVIDQLFRLLGIVTFWRSLDPPSPARLADVNRALDSFLIEVGPDAKAKCIARAEALARGKRP